MKHRPFLMNEFPLPLTSNSPWTPEGTPEKSMRIYFRWEKKTQVVTISSADFKLPVLFVASCFILKHVLPQMLCFLPLSVALWPLWSAWCLPPVCLPLCVKLSNLLLPFTGSFLTFPGQFVWSLVCFSSQSALESSLDKPFVFPEMGGTWWRRANQVSMSF